MQQIVAPYQPGVFASSFDSSDGQTFGFGPGDEIAVRLDERVARPTCHPEEFQVCFLRGIGAGEAGQMLVEMPHVDCGTHAGDVGELVGVIEADFFKVINTDGVWCLHINSANEVHPEQAAKLVFSKYNFKLQPIISISDARERDTIPLSTSLPTT